MTEFNFKLLNEKEAAELLNLSLATLRRRRCDGRPPRFIKIGASVRYCAQDLDDFIEASRVKNEEAA
jgi:predicted DNA-binding transcriptional regulator AlpA